MSFSLYEFVAPVLLANQHANPVASDVNECEKNNGGCDSNRKCVNTAGGMKCNDCAAGWDNDGEKGCKGLCRLFTNLIFIPLNYV